MGLSLFKGDTVNKEHSFCLFKCFSFLKKEQDITFTDSSVERILDIKMLLPFEGKLLLQKYNGMTLIETPSWL